MSLAENLIAVRARERSATGDRYDYQTMWGLVLLFEQHGGEKDYAIIFEFHDDDALLDSSTDPKKIRFYQVKTKSTYGGWTLASLLNRAKSGAGSTKKKPSYIDRMFDSVDKFGSDVLSVDFVSNQQCSLNGLNGKFRFSELDSENFKKVFDSLRDYFPKATISQVGILGFLHTNLSLEDVAAHIRGKLQAFIAENLGEVRFSPEAVYRAIVEECRRRANSRASYANFQDAVKEKGITRKNVQEWLDAIECDQRAPEWAEISVSYDIPFAQKRLVSREYNLYRATALSSANEAAHRVRLSIRSVIPDVLNSTELSLAEMVNSVYTRTELIAKKYLAPFNSYKLKAMIIYEIYTN